MRFGRLAGNDSINTLIYQCLDSIDPRDATTFARRFRSEADPQRFHTLRELICGAELFRHGLRPRYEQALGASTPDWTIYDATAVPNEIVDVATLHPTYEIGQEIADAVGRGQIWTGWVTTAPDRLYQKLQSKFGSYAAIAERKQIAFVVALFSEFLAPIDTEEVAYVVFDLHSGLFKGYHEVSGVIHFELRDALYKFSALANLSIICNCALFGRSIRCGLTLRSTGRAGSCFQLGGRWRGAPVTSNVSPQRGSGRYASDCIRFCPLH